MTIFPLTSQNPSTLLNSGNFPISTSINMHSNKLFSLFTISHCTTALTFLLMFFSPPLHWFVCRSSTGRRWSIFVWLIIEVYSSFSPMTWFSLHPPLLRVLQNCASKSRMKESFQENLQTWFMQSLKSSVKKLFIFFRTRKSQK